ncbi:hypothetical protein C8J57DRAFT_1470251 [Mycena rebaudengoi]|nr:hypothetical protein C8J57DRAFT_1470251 [Mycena rebaudengoi]
MSFKFFVSLLLEINNDTSHHNGLVVIGHERCLVRFWMTVRGGLSPRKPEENTLRRWGGRDSFGGAAKKSKKQRREPAQKMEERSKLEQVIIDLVWALIWPRHCPNKRPNGKKISPPRFWAGPGPVQPGSTHGLPVLYTSLEAQPYSAAKGKKMLEEWFEVREASHRYLELELSLLRLQGGNNSEIRILRVDQSGLGESSPSPIETPLDQSINGVIICITRVNRGWIRAVPDPDPPIPYPFDGGYSLTGFPPRYINNTHELWWDKETTAKKKKDKSIIKGIKDIVYPESWRRDLLAVWALIWTMPWPNKRPNQINDHLLQLGPLLHLLCRFPSLFFALLCSSSKTISPTLCRLSVINPTPQGCERYPPTPQTVPLPIREELHSLAPGPDTAVINSSFYCCLFYADFDGDPEAVETGFLQSRASRPYSLPLHRPREMRTPPPMKKLKTAAEKSTRRCVADILNMNGKVTTNQENPQYRVIHGQLLMLVVVTAGGTGCAADGGDAVSESVCRNCEFQALIFQVEKESSQAPPMRRWGAALHELPHFSSVDVFAAAAAVPIADYRHWNRKVLDGSRRKDITSAPESHRKASFSKERRQSSSLSGQNRCGRLNAAGSRLTEKKLPQVEGKVGRDLRMSGGKATGTSGGGDDVDARQERRDGGSSESAAEWSRVGPWTCSGKFRGFYDHSGGYVRAKRRGRECRDIIRRLDVHVPSFLDFDRSLGEKLEEVFEEGLKVLMSFEASCDVE